MAFEQFLTLGFWTYIAISSIISTIAIYIGVKLTKEAPNIMRAFLVALVANVISYLGIMGLVAGYLPIPFAYLIVSALVWILLIKFFFNMNFKHALMVGIIAFVITYVLGMLGIAAMINGFFT